MCVHESKRVSYGWHARVCVYVRMRMFVYTCARAMICVRICVCACGCAQERAHALDCVRAWFTPPLRMSTCACVWVRFYVFGCVCAYVPWCTCACCSCKRASRLCMRGRVFATAVCGREWIRARLCKYARACVYIHVAHVL